MKKLFTLFVLALTVIPSLVFLGFRESAALAGVEAPPPQTIFRWNDFKTGTWQRHVAEFFGKRFFGRTAATRTANQIYEVLNFGEFHRGSSGDLRNLADGALVEGYYVRPYLEGRSVDPEASADAWRTIRQISDRLAERNIDTVFVLAPDKISAYPAGLPAYVRKLWRVRRGPPQRDFAKVLAAHGIRHIDANEYLMRRSAEFGEPMFSFGGVHWNALGVGLMVEKLLSDLNAESADRHRYRFLPMRGVERSKAEIYGDYDVAKLLNLWRNAVLDRGECYRPVFEDARMQPGEGSVLVFGDSFGGQLQGQLYHARAFAGEKIVFCDKRAVTGEELDRILPDLRLVIFVYQPPYCYGLESSFGPILRDLDEKLAVRLRGEQTYELGDRAVFVRGFSSLEESSAGHHLWTEGNRADLHLSLVAGMRGRPLIVRMTVSGFGLAGRVDFQRAGIAVNGADPVEYRIAEKKTLEIPVSAEQSAEGCVDLILWLPDATSPKALGLGDDARQLSLMFEALSVSAGI